MAGYVQDLVTRIINVQWGGGIFIAGNYDGNIYRLGEDREWQSLGKLDFDKYEGDMYIGTLHGSASALVGENRQQVFVLVGGGEANNAKGIIMASIGGEEWQRVYQIGAASDTFIQAIVFGVTWNKDDQLFYAGAHETHEFNDPDTGDSWMSETDILLQSSNGFSWSVANSHEIKIEAFGGDPLPPWPEYNTGFLAAHCSDMVKDERGNNVPDGNYGYDKDRKLLVEPNSMPSIAYLTGAIGPPSASAGIKVTKLDPEDTAPFNEATGIPTSCVAFAGDVWVVAGGVQKSPATGLGGSSQAAILEADGWKRNDPTGITVMRTITGVEAG